MFWSWTMWSNETSASYNTQLQHNYFTFFFFSTLWWVDVIYTYNYSEFPSNTVPLAVLYLQWSLEGFIFIFFNDENCFAFRSTIVSIATSMSVLWRDDEMPTNRSALNIPFCKQNTIEQYMYIWFSCVNLYLLRLLAFSHCNFICSRFSRETCI